MTSTASTTGRVQPQGAEFFGQSSFNSFAGLNTASGGNAAQSNLMSNTGLNFSSPLTPQAPAGANGLQGLNFASSLQPQPATSLQQPARLPGTIGGIPNFGATFGSTPGGGASLSGPMLGNSPIQPQQNANDDLWSDFQ
jgi:hypothetical protein